MAKKPKGTKSRIKFEISCPLDENIRTLRISSEKGTIILGCVYQGRFELDVAEQDAKIFVHLGHLRINGREYAPGWPCDIKKGERIVLEETDHFAIFVCTFV